MTRRLFTLVPLLLVLALPALAQQGNSMRGPGDPAQRAQVQTARLDSLLDLTDSQAAALKTLLTEQMTEMQAQMQAARAGGQRPDRAAMDARRAQHQQAVEALLTPAQVATYRAFVAEQAARRPQNRRGNN